MKCQACNSEINNPSRFSYTPTTMDKLKLFDEREILCCPECGFGMIDQDVNDEVLAKYYHSEYSGKAKKRAETISIDVKTESSTDLRAISQLSLIQQYVELNNNSVILEIGAGAGGFLFALRKAGYQGRYIAVEPQSQAHSFLEKHGAEVEKQTYTVSLAKKYESQVDLVFMSHSLEHFNPTLIPGIVASVFSMLKEGGCFFCEVPNADIQKYPNAGERVVPHLSFFTEESLLSLFERLQFKIEFLKTCGQPQLEKDHQKQMQELQSGGYFEYEEDSETGILRNRKYHEYLELERGKQAKRQRRMLLLVSLLGYSRALKVLELLRKIKKPGAVRLLGSQVFHYGDDREFIRSIAVK